MHLPDWLTNVDLWSAALGALVVLLGSRYPIAVTVIKAILDRIVKPAPAKPADPKHPVTTPPASPDHPLIDAAVELIKRLARERFPWLPADQAVIKYAAEDLERMGESKAAYFARREQEEPVDVPL